MGCEYAVNPFADPDDLTGLCGSKDVRVVQFRRKSDGVVQESERCVEHLTDTNEAWVVVADRRA